MVRREIGEERGRREPEDVAGRLDAVVRRGWTTTTRRRGGRAARPRARLGEETAEESRYRAAEVRRGFLTLLAGLAAGGPVVLVFEDLHEADPDLLDLLEELVRDARKAPAHGRLRGPLGVPRGAPRLGGRARRRRHALGGAAHAAHARSSPSRPGDFDDEEQAERVAEHAGGNPFFIVETTGMLMHEQRGAAAARRRPEPRLLPASVQAVIAERIDHLSPAGQGARAPRLGLRRAALSTCASSTLIADPDRTCSRSWRTRSSCVPRRGAAERVALPLATCCATSRTRAGQAGAPTAASAPGEPARGARDRPSATRASIAYHLEQAARAALDLNPKDRAIAERAVEALAHAGDLARRRIESRAAADLYERALALAGPEPAGGSARR